MLAVKQSVASECEDNTEVTKFSPLTPHEYAFEFILSSVIQMKGLCLSWQCIRRAVSRWTNMHVTARIYPSYMAQQGALSMKLLRMYFRFKRC